MAYNTNKQRIARTPTTTTTLDYGDKQGEYDFVRYDEIQSIFIFLTQQISTKWKNQNERIEKLREKKNTKQTMQMLNRPCLLNEKKKKQNEFRTKFRCNNAPSRSVGH